MEPQELDRPVHLYRVVIVGARHGNNTSHDYIEGLMKGIVERLKNVIFITMGCERGVGQSVRSVCLVETYRLLQFEVFTKEVDAINCEVAFMARHHSLVNIGEEFHIFVSQSRQSNIEDLVDLVKQIEAPWKVYGNFGSIIENKEAETIPRAF